MFQGSDGVKRKKYKCYIKIIAPIWKLCGEESLLPCHCHQAVSAPEAGSHFGGPDRRRDVMSLGMLAYGSVWKWRQGQILLLPAKLRAGCWWRRNSMGERWEGRPASTWCLLWSGKVLGMLPNSAPAMPDLQSCDKTSSCWPLIWKIFLLPFSLDKPYGFFQPWLR